MSSASDSLPGLPLALKDEPECPLKNAGSGIMTKRPSGATSQALENKAIKKIPAENRRTDLKFTLSERLIFFCHFRFCLPLPEALLCFR